MRYIRAIHKWAGLLCGVFMLVLCLTGAFIAVGKLAGSHAPVFRWMARLHRSLFLGDAGHMVVNVATLLILMEIITGYLLWGVMAGKTGIRRSLRWNFPTRLMGLHNFAGVWAGIPLLIMAFTGLDFNYGLHVGAWWGIPSRLLWLAAALLVATLPVTGLLITLKHTR